MNHPVQGFLLEAMEFKCSCVEVVLHFNQQYLEDLGVLIDLLEVVELQRFMVEGVDLIMALMEVSLMCLGVEEEEFKEPEVILVQVGVVVNLLVELEVGPYLEEVGVMFPEVVVMSFEEQEVIQSLGEEEVIQ